MSSTAEAPTRERYLGVRDKLCLMEAMAWQYADDSTVDDVVRQALVHADNSALEQFRAWQSRCEAIRYRRENGERYRHPVSVLRVGGDCDDQVIVACAGLRALGIPCKVEILSDELGWGFHVRARVGLPPHRPQAWPILDPVWMSEAQWAMEGSPPQKSSPSRRPYWSRPSAIAGSAAQSSSAPLSPPAWLWPLAALMGVAWLASHLLAAPEMEED